MITISEIWNTYLSTKTFKPESIKKDIQRYQRHIYPYWCDKDFLTLSVKDIILYRQYLSNFNLSPQSIKHCLSLLRRALNRAVQLEVLPIQVPHFEMPITNNARIRFLTLKEANLLLSILYEKSELWHDITLFALNTGLRASEIFSLQPISINEALQSIVLFETKNNLTRIVPLNNIANSIVKKYLAMNMQFIFSDYKIKQVSKIFRDCVKISNLNKNITDPRNKVVFHTLRHTFASWLVQQGIPIPVVGSLLGHKDLKMTMRYSHLAPDQNRYAVTILNDIQKNIE